MDEHDDDFPLGLPRAKRTGARGTDEPILQKQFEREIDLGRHPDDEIGIARQRPSTAHLTTQEELAAVEAAEETAARQEYERSLQLGLSQFEHWRHRIDQTLLWVIVAIVAFVALFVAYQTVQILAVLAIQPLPLRLVGYAFLLAILSFLAAFAVRLAIQVFRLRVNQQISTAQLRELSRRAELRDLAEQDKAKAKANLQEYLRTFPLDQRASNVGTAILDASTLSRLSNARDYLLDHERFSDYDGWLDDFRGRFQDVLQDSASTIIRNWMKLVALKTAVSPYGPIDSLIVLYCGYGMIGDLCRLYNLRMSRPGIIRLLTYNLVSAVAAKEIETVTEDVATELVGLVGGSLVGKVAPKAAEGGANALLLRRLGHATVALLSPVSTR